MNLERYEYEIKRTYKEYLFYCEGPKGRILKVVRFVWVPTYPAPYYHLVFGDWNEERHAIDDESITNNKDVEKVLATEAAIVFNFTAIFGRVPVYAKGRSPDRTRLYQININKFLGEIEEKFDIQGRIDNQWESFQRGVNYQDFLIFRKEFIIRPEYIILEEQTKPYMTSSKENKEEKKRVYNDRIIDGPELVDINNDPVVLKKLEEGRKAFEKCPMPEWILKRYNLR